MASAATKKTAAPDKTIASLTDYDRSKYLDCLAALQGETNKGQARGAFVTEDRREIEIDGFGKVMRVIPSPHASKRPTHNTATAAAMAGLPDQQAAMTAMLEAMREAGMGTTAGADSSKQAETSDHRADAFRHAEMMRREQQSSGTSHRQPQNAAENFALSLLWRLGGAAYVDETCLPPGVEVVDSTDMESMRRLVAVKSKGNRAPFGPAGFLFGLADDLDDRAAAATGHEAGVYADLAEELRASVRIAFAGLLTKGMLDLLDDRQRTNRNDQHGQQWEGHGSSQLPPGWWEHIPEQYKFAAFDGTDGGNKFAWFAYETEPEYRQGGWRDGGKYTSITRYDDHGAMYRADPPPFPSKSLTRRPDNGQF